LTVGEVGGTEIGAEGQGGGICDGGGGGDFGFSAGDGDDVACGFVEFGGGEGDLLVVLRRLDLVQGGRVKYQVVDDVG
jgi:hypothetical protein